MDMHQENLAAKNNKKTWLYIGVGAALMMMFSTCCCCGLSFSTQKGKSEAPAQALESNRKQAPQQEKNDILHRLMNNPRVELPQCASTDSKQCSSCCRENGYQASFHMTDGSCQCVKL